eukprot:CAMPEP_0171060292 /NCGR_PEP_ID=MMETSP0766_2-20121228/3741_1 /TAXON_ID=439317 /ORGANISM="Gambierdiscus australes, Strain CAWD 149" /LENGTH=32 /DNA_ID= /DNA_START= /DNA_END= /DNA_ORIENTATION=
MAGFKLGHGSHSTGAARNSNKQQQAQKATVST